MIVSMLRIALSIAFSSVFKSSNRASSSVTVRHFVRVILALYRIVSSRRLEGVPVWALRRTSRAAPMARSGSSWWRLWPAVCPAAGAVRYPVVGDDRRVLRESFGDGLPLRRDAAERRLDHYGRRTRAEYVGDCEGF
jgi:hypothetical protein